MAVSVVAKTSNAEAFLAQLGVTSIINAGGTNTRHAGTIPRAECMAAMQDMCGVFVRMDEYMPAVGQAIADLIGVPAAAITSGATGGLVLQAAAAMTRNDLERAARLPDATGMPNELLIQRKQRFSYDKMYRLPGAKLVEVGRPDGCTAAEVEAAITANTAGLIDVQSPFKAHNGVPLPELATLGQKYNIPVLCDAASMLPPRANLKKFFDLGADLVVFSGGKGIRGPQSSGIVLGKKEWVEAAHINNAPFANVARSQKVSREEAAGLLAALKAFLAEDEAAETANYRLMSQHVVDRIQGIPGVSARVMHDYDHHYPQAVITLTHEWRGPNRDEIHARLLAGSPRIYLSALEPGNILAIDPINLQPGEVEIVADTLRAALLAAIK